MGSKRVGHARIAALVNKNMNELSFPGNSGLSAGSGFNHSDGDGSPVYASWVERFGDVIKTSVYVDLDGLMSAADGDIIGANDQANCHIGQHTTGKMGTLFAIKMVCVEAPATGEPDIDLYSASEATGTENAAVSGLTETLLVETNADWTTGLHRGAATLPADGEYFYLVASGGGAAGEYSAGKFIIEFWGKAV